MKDTSPINLFPKMQIKPFDGMSITADIWDQAHDEHRQVQRAHNVFSHGSGIIAGLDVVANDPPDQYVFISPGVAIDPVGNVIVVPEPVAYDFGASTEGTLFLLLGQGERELGGVGNEARYTQSEFVIAARTSFPKRPSVELARVNLSAAGKAIHNAKDYHHPGPDTIDIRYRSQVGPAMLKDIKVFILEMGKNEPAIEKGWDHLGQFCQINANYHVIVDGGKQFPQDLGAYDLLYLGCKGSFTPSASHLKTISDYLKDGKTLLVEALDVPAQEDCQKMFKKLKLNPGKPASDIPLLYMPYLFAGFPAGPSGDKVEVARHLLYSTAGYALSWAGKAAKGLVSRSDIRSAHEWGVNLIRFSLEQDGETTV
jgi:hypothetical protein